MSPQLVHPNRNSPSESRGKFIQGLKIGAKKVKVGLWVSLQFSSVQLLSCVWLFATPWIAAHQASLSITNSRSLPKLMSIKSVMPSRHLILCRPLLLLPPIPPSGSFPMSQFFTWGNQSTGVSALASLLPKKSQGWYPSEWEKIIANEATEKN